MTTMSDRSARFARMSQAVKRCPACVALALDGEFCPEHAENWARTEWLIAVLAQRHRVEIEVEDGRFSQIDTMALDGERIIITTKDGRRVDRSHLEGAPRWRQS
jgi:mannose/cellobiose epimerase-like protein (N-acyl-D-glucosamine 2-epimerase family)